MHVLIAKQILCGYGHVFPEADPGDLSRVLYKPINFWPPGYSLLLVPFMWIGLKGWWVIAVSDALGIIILYGIWFRLIRKAFPAKQMLYTLLLFSFFTFGFTPLGMPYSLGTNLWALNCFSLAILQLVDMVQTHKEPTGYALGWYHFFAFLGSFFRYAFYPVSLILSVGLLLFYGRQPVIKKVWVSWLVPVLLFGFFFAYQAISFQQFNYIDSYHNHSGNRLYPENLAYTAAWITQSFVHPVLYGSVNWFYSLSLYLGKINTGDLIQVLKGLVRYGWVFLLNLGLVLGLKRLWQKGNPSEKKWLKLSLFISISQSLLLVILSLYYPAETFIGPNINISWTYVQEPRYYNVASLCILLIGLYAAIFIYRKKSIGIFLILIIINIGVFVSNKEKLHFNPERNMKDRNFWILEQIPADLIPANAVLYEKKLVQRRSFYHFVSTMFAEQGVPTLKYIPPARLKTGKPISLIIVVDKIEDEPGDAAQKQLAQKNGARKLTTLFSGNIELYTLELLPGQKLTL